MNTVSKTEANIIKTKVLIFLPTEGRKLSGKKQQNNNKQQQQQNTKHDWRDASLRD